MSSFASIPLRCYKRLQNVTDTFATLPFCAEADRVFNCRSARCGRQRRDHHNEWWHPRYHRWKEGTREPRRQKRQIKGALIVLTFSLQTADRIVRQPFFNQKRARSF